MSATSVQLGYPLWVDGMTFNSLLGRTIGTSMFYTQAGTSIAPISGVINNHNNSFTITATGGMGISVGVGDALIGNAASSLDGPYLLNLSSSAALTVPTADPSNPRIDLIVADVYDNGDDTSYCAIELITGTAAPSPSVPSPASGVSYIPLAQIAVAAGTTSISSGDITDERAYTSAGGAIFYPNGVSAAVGNGGHDGRLGFDYQNDRFFHDNGVSSTIPAAQVSLLPWTSARAYNTTSHSLGATGATLTAVTITTDGVTDIAIDAAVGQVTGPGSGDGVTYVQVSIDSTKLFRQYIGNPVVDGATGCSLHWVTGTESGDTPSAGTHTITLSAVCAVTGATASGGIKLAVTPICL